MDKQVTVIVKGCELYDGNKKYSDGAEYTCGEAEAKRLVERKLAVLKDGAKKPMLDGKGGKGGDGGKGGKTPAPELPETPPKTAGVLPV